MTVKDLIEKLQTMPQDERVCCYDTDGYYLYTDSVYQEDDCVTIECFH